MQDLNKLLYTTITSQTLSKDGRFLFCGSSYGEIFIYSIESISNCAERTANDEEKTMTKPLIVHQANENGPVNSLAFHDNFLMVGLNGEIQGYLWSSKLHRIARKAWTVKIPTAREHSDLCEVNYMWIDRKNSEIFAGCGDNKIYCISLDDGRINREFEGHKDYIHCVDGCTENLLVSASEDGSVKLWDTRDKKATNTLEPYKNENLNRPQFGKWQGTCSLTEDWLVCGGGPKFSMWHLRSLECTTEFSFPDRVHVSGFIDDLIYTGGDCNKLYQYNYNGEISAEIPVSGSSIYSVVWQQAPWSLMAISGASSDIDFCTNFNYKDLSLNVYK